MKKPVISIVTICFNSASTVEETIKSVLGQDYPYIDYVMIDGGSTDGTVDIINRYAERLGYFCSEPDEGISDAFNKGVKRAKGDIVCIINSDDILLPGALKSVAEHYEEGVDIYRGNVIIRNKETGFAGRDIPSMKFPLMPFFVNVDHQGTFVSLDAHRRWGYYDTNFRYMMDHDFLARCYQGGARFKYVPVDVAEFRLGGVSVATIPQKRYDLEHIVLNNGGGPLLAKFCYWYFYSFDCIKRIIIKFFGINFLKRLHYKKV
ncbi:MAG: glycosyltransferase [Bacteroidaceae bacterium]|nr:glycosyltransferase [Bacteroidaceae bacterium]